MVGARRAAVIASIHRHLDRRQRRGVSVRPVLCLNFRARRFLHRACSRIAGLEVLYQAFQLEASRCREDARLPGTTRGWQNIRT
jgi:hypothetical protein